MKEYDKFLRGIRELDHIGTQGGWKCQSLSFESVGQLDDDLQQMTVDQSSPTCAYDVAQMVMDIPLQIRAHLL